MMDNTLPMWPNHHFRHLLLGAEEVMGKNGVTALLHLAKLSKYVDNLPSDDLLVKEIPFTDVTALVMGFEEMGGPIMGRGLAYRSARASMHSGYRSFFAGRFRDDAYFNAVPLGSQLKIGIPAFVSWFMKQSDSTTTLVEHEGKIHLNVYECPFCWEREAPRKPRETSMPCKIMEGILQEALYLMTRLDFEVREIECKAMGHDCCVFAINKTPIEG